MCSRAVFTGQDTAGVRLVADQSLEPGNTYHAHGHADGAVRGEVAPECRVRCNVARAETAVNMANALVHHMNVRGPYLLLMLPAPERNTLTEKAYIVRFLCQHSSRLCQNPTHAGYTVCITKRWLAKLQPVLKFAAIVGAVVLYSVGVPSFVGNQLGKMVSVPFQTVGALQIVS
jgi:hypothetical protein